MKKVISAVIGFSAVFLLVTNCFATYYKYAKCTYYTQYQSKHKGHHTCESMPNTITLECYEGSFTNWMGLSTEIDCTPSSSAGYNIFHGSGGQNSATSFKGTDINDMCQKLQNAMYTESAFCKSTGAVLTKYQTSFS